MIPVVNHPTCSDGLEIKRDNVKIAGVGKKYRLNIRRVSAFAQGINKKLIKNLRADIYIRF
jgi:hypothetical protein